METETQTQKYFVIQNLGAVDRIIRAIIGGIMLFVPFVLLVQPGTELVGWYPVSMMLSIYPWLTSICGYDPFYQAFNVKSCDLEGRNQCGSFPYEVDALLGHQPIPEDDITHELMHSRHSRKA